MRRTRTKQDKVALFLKRDFLIGKKQHKVTADQDVEGRKGLPGAHVSRVSPFACVYHFNSSSEVRSGLSSAGMKCPRNQPRVSFEASMTFPESEVDVSDPMSLLLAICRPVFRAHPRWLPRERRERRRVQRVVRLCSLLPRPSFEAVEIVVLPLVFILAAYRDVTCREEPSILCRAK